MKITVDQMLGRFLDGGNEDQPLAFKLRHWVYASWKTNQPRSAIAADSKMRFCIFLRNYIGSSMNFFLLFSRTLNERHLLFVSYCQWLREAWIAKWNSPHSSERRRGKWDPGNLQRPMNIERISIKVTRDPFYATRRVRTIDHSTFANKSSA